MQYPALKLALPRRCCRHIVSPGEPRWRDGDILYDVMDQFEPVCRQSNPVHRWLYKRGDMVSRREVLRNIAAGTAGMAINSSAKSYGQILGSNDRLNFAIMGLRWRGYAISQH